MSVSFGASLPNQREIDENVLIAQGVLYECHIS